MASTEIVDVYFNSYHLELETRSAIDNRVSFSVGIAGLLVAIPGFYLLHYPTHSDPTWLAGTFWVLAGLGTGALLLAFCFLAAATWSREFTSYKVLGPLDSIEEYRNGFYAWKQKDSNAPDPDEAFRSYLAEDLARAAAHNQDLNVKRSLRWFRGTGWMFVALVLYAAAAVPFFSMRGIGPKDTPIQFTINPEHTMQDETTQEQPTSNPPTQDTGNPIPRPPLRDTASENPPDRVERIPEQHKEVRN